MVKQFLTRLGELAEQHRTPSNALEASAGKTVFGTPAPVNLPDRALAFDNVWVEIAGAKKRDKEKVASGGRSRQTGCEISRKGAGIDPAIPPIHRRLAKIPGSRRN
jgi:hypothetical protein